MEILLAIVLAIPFLAVFFVIAVLVWIVFSIAF